MPRLSDSEIDSLLRRLPRQVATAGFRHRVLERLAARPAAPRLAPAWAAAAAVAAALVLAVWLRPPAPAPADSRQLLAEQQELMRELEALKAALREPAAPVLYIGGDERVDLVLDLGEVWDRSRAVGPRPASLGPQATPRPAISPRAEGNRRP